VKTFVAVMLLVLAGGWIAPAFSDPPAHAPAHGWRAKHRYTYYRDHEIYYSPESSVWFWMDRDREWHVGARLPARLQQFTVHGISVELGSDKPYREHAYVVERYGKGPPRRRSRH
jgi:hypothetical protein